MKHLDFLKPLKEKVLKTAKAGHKEGLFVSSSGNLSALHREAKLVVITPTSILYDEMTLEDLAVISLAGVHLEGKTPSSEWRMHLEVYKKRADVGAVFHTHSPYATAFAVIREPIPLIHIEMTPHIGGDIKVARFAAPGSEELGEEALKALKNRRACLLSNHGVLTVGPFIEGAYAAAVYAENVAKIYHFALSVGTPVLLSKGPSLKKEPVEKGDLNGSSR